MAATKVNLSGTNTNPSSINGNQHVQPSSTAGRDANWQDLECLHNGLRLLGWTADLERWSDGGFINVSRSGSRVGLVTWSETQGTITISPSNNRFPDKNFPVLRSDMMEQIKTIWPEGALYPSSGSATIFINSAYQSPDFLVVE
jgi:hypothetical protein